MLVTIPGWVGFREPRGQLGGRYTKDVTICPTYARHTPQANTTRHTTRLHLVHSSCTSSQRTCNGRCLARGAREEYDTPGIHHARVRAVICWLWHPQHKKRSPWHLCADGACAHRCHLCAAGTSAPMSPVRRWHLGPHGTWATCRRHLGYTLSNAWSTEGTWVPMQTVERTFAHKWCFFIPLLTRWLKMRSIHR